MAFIRGHFYIWAGPDFVSFGHGRHVMDDGEPIGGRPQGKGGSADNNTLCPYRADCQEPTHVDLPDYIVEEFVAMYWSRMSDDDRAEAIERVSHKYGGGNFGADAIAEGMGVPTVMDVIMKKFPDRFQEGDEK